MLTLGDSSHGKVLTTEFNKYSATEGLLHPVKSKKTKCNDLAGKTLCL